MPKTIAIIAPSPVPFEVGGAEKLWLSMQRALMEIPDLLVELIKLPCRDLDFVNLLKTYRSFYNLDLSHFDMVISTKYPAWMVRHPCHVVYMQHTMRGLYDTYHITKFPETLDPVPAYLADLMKIVRKAEPADEDIEAVFEMGMHAWKTNKSTVFNFPRPLIREIVHFFDRAALLPGKIKAYLAISETVRRRKDYLPANVPVRVLPHPSDMKNFKSEPGEYIFTCSRLNGTKRVDMIINAMSYVEAPVKLKIAGTGPDEKYLKQLAANDGRIEFLGYVPDAYLPEFYARALFVPFAPYNEDYGLITIEAMSSGKPVVTVSDSGGVCEFVRDGETGLLAEPDPESLGLAMNRLAMNPALCEKMGRTARELVSGISWKKITDSLLAHAPWNVARADA